MNVTLCSVGQMSRPEASVERDVACENATQLDSVAGEFEMEHGSSEQWDRNPRSAARELFGEMRSSTPKEQALFEVMLERMSIPMDVDILDL